MKKTRKERLAKMIDAIENDRPIEAVLLAISKGQKVTPEEKHRAQVYERNKRQKP